MDFVENYKKANNKLVLLDYDGTLVHFDSHPGKARPSEPLLDILERLAKKPLTRIIIITGRECKDIDRMIGHLSIDIIAEHGAYTKENGKWNSQIDDKCSWKKSRIPLLNRFSIMCPGSFVEEKQFSLAWHYRKCKSEQAYKYSRELIDLLMRIKSDCNLKVIDGNKVIEIMPEKVGKGEAVKKILEQNKYDYILSIGDDKTDEEMFDFLSDISYAFTIKVGNGNTVAKYRVKNEKSVIKLLEQLLACE